MDAPLGERWQSRQLTAFSLSKGTATAAPRGAKPCRRVRDRLQQRCREVVHLLCSHNVIEWAARGRKKWSALPFEFGKLPWRTHLRREMKRFTVERNIMPNLASQMRVAFVKAVLKTGSSSPGELLITCSTSDAAVCCSRASLKSSVRWRSSLSSRTFSIAITAWSAKVGPSSICLSVNGRTARRSSASTPIGGPSGKRGTASAVRVPVPARESALEIEFRICEYIRNMNGATFKYRSSGQGAARDLDWKALHQPPGFGRMPVIGDRPIVRAFCWLMAAWSASHKRAAD